MPHSISRFARFAQRRRLRILFGATLILGTIACFGYVRTRHDQITHIYTGDVTATSAFDGIFTIITVAPPADRRRLLAGFVVQHKTTFTLPDGFSGSGVLSEKSGVLKVRLTNGQTRIFSATPGKVPETEPTTPVAGIASFYMPTRMKALLSGDFPPATHAEFIAWSGPWIPCDRLRGPTPEVSPTENIPHSVPPPTTVQ